MRFLNVITALDKNYGIGFGGKIPWHVNADMKHFKEVTQNSVLIMGRITYESIPLNKRNFEGRRGVIVISKTAEADPYSNYFVCKNLSEGIVKGYQLFSFEEKVSIFICGGENLYREVLEHYMHLIENIYITYVPGDFLTDRFFPLKDNDKFSELRLLLKTYQKKKHPLLFHFQEKNRYVVKTNLITGKIKSFYNNYITFFSSEPDEEYIEIIQDILSNGEEKEDRTGTGTYSIFNADLSFDLQKGFPLLSRRKIFWKGILEETLFFLKGKTQTKELEEKGVNIWKGNTSRKFLDSRKLFDLEEGDMGLGYGFQWRNFNGSQQSNTKSGENKNESEMVKGIDQIQKVIHDLKTNPHSRRHIVTAWNPFQLDKMALPPCHILFQFYVRQNTFLDCKMIQRSCDVMLGLPFNIGSYSLITHIIAEKTGYLPGKLYISLGDTHIYKNHIKGVTEFLKRPCLRFPTLQIKDKEKSIDDLQSSDFSIQEYGAFPSINMEMAI